MPLSHRRRLATWRHGPLAVRHHRRPRARLRGAPAALWHSAAPRTPGTRATSARERFAHQQHAHAGGAAAAGADAGEGACPTTAAADRCRPPGSRRTRVSPRRRLDALKGDIPDLLAKGDAPAWSARAADTRAWRKANSFMYV